MAVGCPIRLDAQPTREGARQSLGSHMSDDRLHQIELKDGTEKSGFVRGGQNKPPRECGNCIWMGMASCGHPFVMDDPEITARTDDGRVPVDADDCCDNFQSLGNVLLWIVRHGATVTDVQGKHGGWQNDPLNETGRSQAQQAKKYLEGKTIKHVFSSDMIRAIETAKIVSGSDPEQDKQLRPWDVGWFTGKDSELYKEQFKEFLKHPAREIPDGESLAEYAARMHKALEKYVAFARENGPTLLVCHSRNFSQFKKQLENKNEFDKPEEWDKVCEGGIMTVLDEDGELKVEIVFNRGDEG